jgi:predicted SAM-dependent methyltransferase
MIFHPRKRIEPHILDALDVLRFELDAWKGRLFRSKRLDTRGREYLQLGSHETPLEGFLNTDFTLKYKADAAVDARFPLPFENSTWRGIYAHHVVEHLSFVDALGLFRECRRVLRPGGVFRMVVPDLEIFLRLYLARDSVAREKIFALLPDNIMNGLNVKTPLEMLDYVFRDEKFNRHLSSWDWETAEFRLREAGFAQVNLQRVNQSADPKLAGHDKPHWAAFSLYVEAAK